MISTTILGVVMVAVRLALGEELLNAAAPVENPVTYPDVGDEVESPWFRWRLGLLDFDQGLVGPFRSVERGFELCGRSVVEVAVQAAGV
ncbi:MAG: hypothetical protein ACXVB5_20900, partial [Isosphaeraceae bacterium]